jgi:hypothetical protein
LRDLIKVLDGRWTVFENACESRSKREVVSSLHELADIRNRLSHPSWALKQPPTEDELSWVKELYGFLTLSLQRARALGGG